MFLVADNFNGVYESPYRPADACVTTMQDFYDSLNTLKADEVIVCTVTDAKLYRKIEAEYGITYD